MVNDQQGAYVEHGAGNWRVIVEETAGYGQGQCSTISQVRPCADRDDALRVVTEFLMAYQPLHPAFPRNRRV